MGGNHVGIVIAVDGDNVTIREGNLEGKTNTFQDAKNGLAYSHIHIESVKIILSVIALKPINAVHNNMVCQKESSLHSEHTNNGRITFSTSTTLSLFIASFEQSTSMMTPYHLLLSTWRRTAFQSFHG